MKPLFLIALLGLTYIVHGQLQPDLEAQQSLLAELGITRVASHVTIRKKKLYMHPSERLGNYEVSLDSFGRITGACTIKGKNCESFVYDSIFGKVSFISRKGHETTFVYDEKGRVTFKHICEKSYLCSTQIYEYDLNNTKKTYRLILPIHLQFHDVSSIDKEELLLQTEEFFTPENYLKELRIYEGDKMAFTMLYDYKKDGLRDKVWCVQKGEKNIWQEPAYDINGRLQTLKVYPSCSTISPNSFPPYIQSFEYNEQGLLVKSTDPSSGTTRIYSYY